MKEKRPSKSSAKLQDNGTKPRGNNRSASKKIINQTINASKSPNSSKKIILLNKPFNVLSQFTDENGRSTLKDFINIPNVYAAGRLDYDSEGLLVLTDNGALANQITSPKHKTSKTYWAQVEGIPNEKSLKDLATGVHLKDGLTAPAKIKIMPPPNIWPRTPPIRERANIPTTWLSIQISEGRNRQVRRMTAHVGHPTLRLIRYRVGSWTIDGIKNGSFVHVSA
jgi:23S rRNA pseudouridine2457 synthase